ncbi:uncharacterized protein LOC122645065 [Telopea speciosissima]|uniref:uncharacterized protein LOC122645065 n=1 Tax=Telopea speciosissima TaxID=54955 RepID=UPI001CC7DAD6|nr:uncharacterized protein LOC122645065 [Telopea speciosissima]
MIKFGAWNTRGINDPGKRHAVLDWASVNNLVLFGLIETRVKESNFLNCSRMFANRWCCIHNYASASSGRIWVMWDEEYVSILPLLTTSQLVHVQVTVKSTHQVFGASFVYGANFASERVDLWNSMTQVRSMTSQPWVVLGDFNSLCYSNEKEGGRPLTLQMLQPLLDCLLRNDLTDLTWSGCHMTWSNRGCGDVCIASKIDRVLVDGNWMDVFPRSFVVFQNPGVSDHSPMVVTSDVPFRRRGKQFYFYNHWVDHVDFFPLVQDVWSQPNGSSPLFSFLIKLKALWSRLKHWSRGAFHGLDDQVHGLNCEIDSLQSQISANPFDPLLQQREVDSLCRLRHLLSVRESELKQRARVRWLQQGDNNTSFFHRSLRSRRSHNQITSIFSSAGVPLTGDEQIRNEAASHFGRAFMDTPQIITTSFTLPLQRGLDAADGDFLSGMFTLDEIKVVVFAADDESAPGVDGFGAGFFKKC